jgi:hypothetical protein
MYYFFVEDSSMSNGMCPIRGTDSPFVTSILYASAYCRGPNEALIGQCVENGVGDVRHCTDLAGRVGDVALVDFSTRSTIGTLGVMHGAYGLSTLVSACRKPTFMGKIFSVFKSSIYLVASAAELFVAFCFPVATIDSRGKFVTDTPPLARL